MGAASPIRSVIPGLCVAAVGVVGMACYATGVEAHLTAASSDLLWRGAVLFLCDLLWVGLGMVAGALIPAGERGRRTLAVVTVAAAAVLFAACCAFRLWAEMGGVYWALALGRPVWLVYLAVGALLGRGIRLLRAG
ncbi:hypothetical protein AAK967_08320 [Atopobiaceae bacterium 24-176]